MSSATHIYKASDTETQFYYSNARPGYGKTEWAIDQMISIKTKWLFVVDRREAISDRIKRIRFKDRLVVINEIHTDSVASRILDWNTNTDNDQNHQILIITHVGLKISDLSYFTGWSIIIDETLDPWTYDTVKTKLTADIVSKYFSINDGLLSIVKDSDVSDLHQDDLLNDTIKVLYNSVRRGNVAVTTDTFHSDKEWQWFSVWNFAQLNVFNQVHILANSFDHSMMYKLMEKDGFKLNLLSLPETRAYSPRKVIIRFFDEDNKASQSFFKSPEGKHALKEMSAYYKTLPSDRIWTKNNEHMNDLNFNAYKLTPKVAGSNDYSAYTKATIIFSAKPDKQEQKIIGEFGIGIDEIIKARELETIIQFVTRTSIRTPHDTRTCEFDVYDETQATDLKSYLDGLGIGLDVQLEHINLGITKRVAKDGRPSKYGKAMTSRERMADKRKRDKELKENMKRLKGDK
jgi:hypothetical protein